jgi:hypothetical protein
LQNSANINAPADFPYLLSAVSDNAAQEFPPAMILAESFFGLPERLYKNSMGLI